MTMPGPAPAWEVTRQLPTTATDDNGNSGEGVRVEYTTSGGVSDYVFVLRPDYTVDKVRTLIADKVATHDAVAQLKG